MAPGWPVTEDFLRRCALEALEGVGDSNLGQWEQFRNETYHLRRRLTPEEQKHVGEAKDIRNTVEEESRRRVIVSLLPHLRNWKE